MSSNRAFISCFSFTLSNFSYAKIITYIGTCLLIFNVFVRFRSLSLELRSFFLSSLSTRLSPLLQKTFAACITRIWGAKYVWPNFEVCLRLEQFVWPWSRDQHHGENNHFKIFQQTIIHKLRHANVDDLINVCAFAQLIPGGSQILCVYVLSKIHPRSVHPGLPHFDTKHETG